MEQKSPPFKFGSESKYKLKVQGKISDTWNDQIGPIKITQVVDDEGVYKTTILFNTRDQAELVGFINTLYELHLPILSLVRVPEKKILVPEKTVDKDPDLEQKDNYDE